MSIFLLMIGICATLLMIFTALRYGIGPIPTSSKVKQRFLSLLPKEIHGSIYELGAGWGTLAFALADRYPDSNVIAIEISIIPCFFIKMRQILFPRSNLRILYADFFQLPLQDAALITCYLFPKAMQRLEKKVRGEKVHAWLATHTFAYPSSTPTKMLYANDLYHTPIYLYKI